MKTVKEALQNFGGEERIPITATLLNDVKKKEKKREKIEEENEAFEAQEKRRRLKLKGSERIEKRRSRKIFIWPSP